MKKYFLIALALYLLVGIGWQVYSCAYPNIGEDGKGPDIPCAGVVWTPITLLGWPLFGIFGFIFSASSSAQSRDVWVSILTLALAAGILAILFFGARRSRKHLRE